MSESSPPPARRVGRPGKLGPVPPGARHRSVRASDAEWAAIVALLKRLRAPEKQGKGERK